MEKTFGFGVSLLKGLLIGVSICLAAILIFAFALKFVSLSAFWVKTVNQIIKVTAIMVACLVSVKGEKGFLKGGAVGLSVVLVTYLLFGLVSGSLTLGVSTLLECAFGILIGILAGILSVNLKK